jgi:predicted DNA-binding transcriptional regulator AlpA
MSKSESRPSLGPRLRTPAAAEYLGIADSTLEKMRVSGTGPEFENVGKSVVYSVSALEEYLGQRRARSTSETGKQAYRPRRRKNTRDNPGGPPTPEGRSPDRPDEGAA